MQTFLLFVRGTLITTLFFLVGCQSSSSGGTPAIQTEHVLSPDGIYLSLRRKTDLAEDLSNKDAFLDDLNTFIVSVAIPAKFYDQVKIIKTDLRTKVTEDISTETADIRDGAFVVEDMLLMNRVKTANQSFRYFVMRGQEKVAEAIFEVRPDLYIKGIQSLTDFSIQSGEYRLGIILMEERSRLVTEGKSVKIIAEKIFAQNSVIETFSDEVAGRTPSLGVPGINGGTFDINTQFATGSLEVFLRGTRGGQAPPALTEGYDGEDGYDGTLESSDCQSDERGTRCICLKEPGNGESGENGDPGPKGSPGLRGGNTGVLHFAVAKHQEFKITVTKIPGLGGPGGEGGPGGRGGKGGRAGEHFVCPAAMPGRDGFPGKNGALGDSGPRGEEEMSCVQLSQDEKQECRS